MRVTYDPDADAAYIYLTEEMLAPGRDSVECDLPPEVNGTVVVDCKDGRIVGLEVHHASSTLHRDLLESAGRPPDRSR